MILIKTITLTFMMSTFVTKSNFSLWFSRVRVKRPPIAVFHRLHYWLNCRKLSLPTDNELSNVTPVISGITNVTDNELSNVTPVISGVTNVFSLQDTARVVGRTTLECYYCYPFHVCCYTAVTVTTGAAAVTTTTPVTTATPATPTTQWCSVPVGRASGSRWILGCRHRRVGISL